ncbi:MAG TPA: SH3 domain-containing protein, partial [Symbiobacteriaceae bacterium]|nr:SH3 domain-containing protein [Symbiobacteriaceae bacterium]
MKRIAAAAVALLLIAGAPGTASAATLRSADQDSLNLRSGPGTTHAIVGSLPAGQWAKIVDQQENWYLIRTASGLEAWVAGWVARVSFADEDAIAEVNTDALNVRQEPSTSAPVLALIKEGDQVRLNEVVGDWWRIRLPDGTEGWVMGTYMKRVSAPAQPAGAQPGVTPPPAARPPVTGVPQAPPPAPASAVPALPPARVLPEPLPAGAKQAWAATASTVYAGRDKKAFEWIDSIKPGEKLTYVDAAEGWVKVETPRGNKGWVPGPAVTLVEGTVRYRLSEGEWSLGFGGIPSDPAAPPAPISSLERRIVSDPEGLRLREKPNTLGKVLTVLPQGELLYVQELKMPWMRVETHSGATGWIHSEYTVLYKDAPPQVPPPAVGGALQATLKVLKPGVLQLDVEARDQAIGQPVVEGNQLIIPVKTGQSTALSLPVGAAGAK